MPLNLHFLKMCTDYAVHDRHIMITEESSNWFLSQHFDHAFMSSAVNLTLEFFPPVDKTEWKTNAPYVKFYPVTQPAKVMS